MGEQTLRCTFSTWQNLLTRDRNVASPLAEQIQKGQLMPSAEGLCAICRAGNAAGTKAGGHFLG